MGDDEVAEYFGPTISGTPIRSQTLHSNVGQLVLFECLRCYAIVASFEAHVEWHLAEADRR